MNCTVNPLYTGENMYPSPPSTAMPAPHLAAPEMPPRVASQEASSASACLLSFMEGIVLSFGLCLCLCLCLFGVFGDEGRLEDGSS